MVRGWKRKESKVVEGGEKGVAGTQWPMEAVER